MNDSKLALARWQAEKTFGTAQCCSVRSTLLVGLLCVYGQWVHAGPVGGEVIVGDASIEQLSSDATQITQNSDRAVIDWDGFNLGSGESLNINQPSTNSILVV